jgi:multimeric flavodoxin WrbA
LLDENAGECIMKDGIVEINRACMTSDVVVYLCPIVFGQFSANIKFALDRWLAQYASVLHHKGGWLHDALATLS